jgi:uncharacterized protein YdeI (YjbR/CyaY-like superfamily)
MPNPDQRIDDYIDKSAEFAKPILNHLRMLVHKNCPAVVETMKWSFPHFEYNGSILCSMASFKQHCTFGFWLGSKMKDPHGILRPAGERNAMGHFGQIKSLKDLPHDKILAAYFKEAMDLTDKGEKISRAKSETKEMTIPPYFLSEVKKNKTALAHFEKFSPSQKKEYVTWITEAKTEATRQKRMATAIEWLAEGKTRNWKYER